MKAVFTIMGTITKDCSWIHNASSGTRPWRWIPRVIAAALCLVYGLSHIALIATGAPALTFDNPVFPFVSNAPVFTLAGVLQLAIGLLCYKLRNSHLADLALAMLLAMLLWYRWGLTFLGAVGSCGCSGYFGSVFGWSAAREAQYAKLGLLVLGLCLVPAAVEFVNRFKANRLTRRLTLIAAFSVVADLRESLAVEVLTLHGNLTVRRVFSSGRQPTVEKECLFTFRGSADGAWSLESTNSVSRIVWSKAYFDGISLYFLQPSAGGAGTNGTILADTNLVLASISQGPLILLPHDDYCEVSSLWLTFCSAAAYKALGLHDYTSTWPIPMWHARVSPRAWGFRWRFGSLLSSDYFFHFFQTLRVVRDTSLDLRSFEQDLRRPEVIYPRDSRSRELARGGRDSLQAYTNVSMGLTMAVEESNMISGMSYPRTARVRLYGGGPKNRPYLEILIVTANASVTDSAAIAVSPTAVRTGVTDYRYGRKNDKRQYVAATYSLRPGQSWRPTNDPKLLARAESYMARGPTLDSYRINVRHYIVWCALCVVIALPIGLYWWKNR